MNKEGEVIGKIEGIQSDGKSVEEAKLGEEVAVSIEGLILEEIYLKGINYIPAFQSNTTLG